MAERVYAVVHGVMMCVCVCGRGDNRKQNTNNRYSEETYNVIHCKQLEVDLTPKKFISVAV